MTNCGKITGPEFVAIVVHENCFVLIPESLRLSSGKKEVHSTKGNCFPQAKTTTDFLNLAHRMRNQDL
jgi:hypothetical protein